MWMPIGAKYLRAFRSVSVWANACKSGCMCRDSSGGMGSLDWLSDSFPTGQVAISCLVAGRVVNIVSWLFIACIFVMVMPI